MKYVVEDGIGAFHVLEANNDLGKPYRVSDIARKVHEMALMLDAQTVRVPGYGVNGGVADILDGYSRDYDILIYTGPVARKACNCGKDDN